MESSMKACRICLSNKKPLCPLFRYKLSGNYAEMLTAIADVKVASNDGLPEKICQKCCAALEKAYLLKCVAERTDRQLRKKLGKMKQSIPTKKISFDSITDIKSEIGPLTVKTEPKWELEIDLTAAQQVDSVEGKDIVIANTVIRKVEPGLEDETKPNTDDPDMVWKKSTASDYDAEYLDDDIFQDDNDEDYVPLSEISKTKFKKPKLKDIKVYKENNSKVVRRTVAKKEAQRTVKLKKEGQKVTSYGGAATAITCYPIMKNGVRGSPILLKRPKDATVRKPSNYSAKSAPSVKEKLIRVVKTEKSALKQREKLVCPVCGILTYTLGNHMSTHQEKKKYTCTECQKAFSQKGNLLIHMKQHTGIKDYICDMCGAGFYSQKSLVRHNLIHKGERPFPCNLCNKKFIARCDLNRHLRIHSGYKPYKCPSCTMSFNAKHQLQNHERMHTGERPYTCQNQNLQRHMRSHMGDKRFTCDICNKSFIQSHHLTNHLIVHTGAKPYSCEMCKVAFSYKVNLNNHVAKVHGVNLKFKSIHTVTEEILRREMGMANETRLAILQIASQNTQVPTPGAHETVQHEEYN